MTTHRQQSHAHMLTRREPGAAALARQPVAGEAAAHAADDAAHRDDGRQQWRIHIWPQVEHTLWCATAAGVVNKTHIQCVSNPSGLSMLTRHQPGRRWLARRPAPSCRRHSWRSPKSQPAADHLSPSCRHVTSTHLLQAVGQHGNSARYLEAWRREQHLDHRPGLHSIWRLL